MPDPSYPIHPTPETDPRFTLGLVVDVAAVLERHGYPRPEGTDWADLEVALYRFFYKSSGR